MHSVHANRPATKVSTDPRAVCGSIDRFFTERLGALQAAGIERERLIIDPGLGYFLGSNPEPSLTVMVGLGRLKARFGAAVLISPSRKSFLRHVAGRDLPNVGPASLAAELYAALQGVDYIRTHDVAALRDGSPSIALSPLWLMLTRSSVSAAMTLGGRSQRKRDSLTALFRCAHVERAGQPTFVQAVNREAAMTDAQHP